MPRSHKSTPSFSQGIARNASQSQYPNLWKGLGNLWVPEIGVQGTTVKDLSDKLRYDGTLTNGATWQAGQRGPAVYLDGSNDYIDLGSSPYFNVGTGDFTIAVYCRPDRLNVGTYEMIFTFSSFYAYLSFFNTDLYWDTNGNGLACRASGVGIAGRWQWVIVTRRGGTDYLYHNGKQVASASDNFNMGAASAAIGRWQFNGSLYMQGGIGFAGFWTRALTPSEVKDLVGGASPLEKKYAFKGRVPGGSAYTKELTETVTGADIIIKGQARSLIEAVTNGDVFTGGKIIASILTETIANADVLVKGITRTLSDTATSTDTLIRQTARTFAEAVTNTDTLLALRSFARELTEVVTNTDVLIRATARTLAEVATSTDAVVRQVARALIESITNTDVLTIQRVLTRVLTEVVTNTDTIVRTIARTLAESATATDTFIKTIARSFLETVTNTDIFAYVKNAIDFITKMFFVRSLPPSGSTEVQSRPPGGSVAVRSRYTDESIKVKHKL